MFRLVSRLNRPGIRMNSNLSGTPEERLAQLGLKIPDTASRPAANYVMSKRLGNVIYTAGHLPIPADGPLIKGKVGVEHDVESGYKAAQVVGLNLLATLKSELGSLDKVKQIVKVNGYVNCPDGYADQPKIMNGCSDLFNNVFGEKGRHARSAVGTNSLPLNVPVEIEIIVEVEN